MAAFQESATAAIKLIRAGSNSDLDWVLVGFTDAKKCDELKVIATGAGGISALAAACPAGDVAYGLVRVTFVFESVGTVQAATTKFVYVYWRPETIPLSRKMKIGTLEGKIKQALSPYHAAVEAAESCELSDELVQSLLGDIAGTTDKTGNRKATFAATGHMTSSNLIPAGGAGERRNKPSFLPTGTAADAAQGRARGAEVAFADCAGVARELGEVKNGLVGAWALWKYADLKTIVLQDSASSGGVKALLDACPDDACAYGVFTVSEQQDVSPEHRGAIVTKKFVFVVWQPEGLPPMSKAKIATHKGAVTEVFREHFPYQYDFFVSSRDELSEVDVLDHIGKLTGTKSRVGGLARDIRPPPGAAASSPAPVAPKNVGGVVRSATLDADVDAIRSALSRARADADASDWIVASFGERGGPRLELTASGSGGLDALRSALPAESFAYGFLRLTEKIDASVLTKFLFVQYQPEAVKPMIKARLSTRTGLVKELFSPFHATLFIDSPLELTQDAAINAIMGDRAKN